jgi:uncharacterized membrane protein
MQTGTSRVETFSDSVMAIIITIMILELKLPRFNDNLSNRSVQNHLVIVLPHFGAYLFSFIMTGILWLNHHHLFHLLRKTDSFLLGLNLFFLFWVSLIPFITGLVGANPLLPISIALYAFIMLMTTLSLSFMQSYTLKKELVHTDEEQELKKKIFQVTLKSKIQTYIASAAYLIASLLAFVSVYISFGLFIIPIILFLLPARIDEEKLVNKIIEKNG